MDVTPQMAAALGILLSLSVCISPSASQCTFQEGKKGRRELSEVQAKRREAFWKACFLEALNARKGKSYAIREMLKLKFQVKNEIVN